MLRHQTSTLVASYFSIELINLYHILNEFITYSLKGLSASPLDKFICNL